MDWAETLSAGFAGSADDREALHAFVDKVRSFAYSPQNRAASDRLLPFSQNVALMTALRSYLAGRIGALGDELTIIPDWSMVVCLIHDGSEPSLQILQQHLTRAIETGDTSRLALFVRYFEQYATSPGIAPLAAAAGARYSALVADSSAVAWARSLGLKHPEYPKEWNVQVSVADQPREKAWGPPPETAHVFSVEIASRPLTTHGEFWTLRLANGSKGGTMLWRAGGDTRPCQANDGSRIVPLPAAPQLASLPAFLRELQHLLRFQLDFSKAMTFQAQGIRQKDAEQRVLRWLAAAQD